VWPGDPRFGQPFPCPACGPQRKAAQQRRRIAGAVAQLDNELGRLRRCTFDNFDLERPLGSATWGGRIFSVEEQRDMLATALRVCKEYASVPAPTGWLFLWGTYGSGKSHLAAAVAQTLAGLGTQATYATAARLWDWLREGYQTNSHADRLSSILDAPALVLDDLGAEKVTDWVDETLFKIINYRYQREMPSVLTSNEGVNRLPGRVASRVKEMAETVFLAVSDYREVIAERRRHAEVAPA
jgi:DNA replication protein DnaC